jgi:predicted metal-dependent hydrolase
MLSSSVQYGSTSIEFRVRFATRRTLEISVHPNGEVEVVAPTGTEIVRIQERVKRRARWILRQRNFFRQFHPGVSPRQYLSGETHLYLGRRYRLKVELGTALGVRLTRGILFVNDVKLPSPEHTEELLLSWYRSRAQEIFGEMFETLWLGQPGRSVKPRLQIKAMRTRWGSLSKGGILTLNPELIRAPRECIEYVICHELCHLHHHDHGVGFFKHLARRLPDWEKRKQRLEKAMA